jgi:hypothetical protein
MGIMKSASFLRRPRKRPFGVSVIIFMLVLYVLFFGIALFSLYQLPFGEFTLDITETDNPTIARAFFILIISIESLIIVGLWHLRRWAWVLIMVQVGLSMLSDFGGYIYGDYSFLSMIINVIIVFYLNQREVQRAFSGQEGMSQ